MYSICLHIFVFFFLQKNICPKMCEQNVLAFLVYISSSITSHYSQELLFINYRRK